MRRPYGPRSKRDIALQSNASHKMLGLIYDKPPMMQDEVAPPRQRREPSGNAVPKEHDEQCAVVAWWRVYSRTRGIDPLQMIAIPNGQLMFRFATNPHGLLAYLHKEGMRDGAPDLIIFHAVSPWHGLAVEMKRTTGGIVSDDQKTMAAVLSKAGYMCRVCKGADEAIGVITEYVEGI